MPKCGKNVSFPVSPADIVVTMPPLIIIRMPKPSAIDLPLREKLGCLPEPADYFSGLEAPSGTTVPRNVLCFQRTSGRDFVSQNQSFHHHHRHVLIANLGGSGNVFVDDEMVSFQQGEALLIRPFQFHHYVVPPKTPLGWLFITFELDPPFEGGQFHVEVAANSPAMRCLELFFDIYLAGRDGDGGSAEAAGFLLGAVLARIFLTSHPAGKLVQNPKNPRLFTRIREYVRANPAIKLDELSRKLGVSESTLRRQFRDAGGDHLGAYLIELKFHLALNDLRRRDLSLTEISFRAGYQSSQAFSRAFRARMGMPPREYRKRIAERHACFTAGGEGRVLGSVS